MASKYKLPFPCLNQTFNLTIYRQRFHCSKIEFNISTCLPIQSVDEIDSIHTLCDAANVIWYAGIWFAVITGIIGNSLAILTIRSLPTSTATFFVGLLAVSDLIAVCIRAVVDFLDIYRMMNRTAPYWDLFPMLRDFHASYSNWLLVLICLERFFTVRFPLQKRYYFTLTHAKISAVVLAVGLFTIYNIATWTLGYNHTKIFKIRNLFYVGVPLVFILVIIALISYQLRRIHKDRQILNGRVHSRVVLSSVDDAQNGGHHATGRQQSTISKSSTNTTTTSTTTSLQEIARLENSITVMMLVAAVCFSVLTIPDCVLFYTYNYSSTSWNTPLLRARWYLFQKLATVFAYLNLSVNFVLYFLSAKRFRTQLYKVMTPRSWSYRRASSQPLQTINNNNSTSDSIPVHPIASGDYVTFHIASDVSPNRATKVTLDNAPLASVEEDSVTYNQHTSREEKERAERRALCSEINGHAGSKL